MGNYCCLKKKQKKKIVLLLLGLDNAGKTVAAKNLVGEPIEEVVPTIGFSVVNLFYMNFRIEMFDLGGGANIRGIWSRYFVDAHGIIFVVDSSDYSRINEVKEILDNLLSHEKISGKPLLLLANKQDNENALDELDLVESLQLEDLVNKEQCPTLVQSCCATATSKKSKLDPGIKKGYNWLLNYIIREYESLNKRVQYDVEEQEIIEAQARQKIIERLRILDEVEKQKRNDDIIELYSEYNMKINGISNSKNSCINSHESNSVCSSESSRHVYYGTVNDLIQEERPKSATQIIKSQLQLEYNQRKRSPKKSLNKTEPINLLGMKLPHSAHAPRTMPFSDHRSSRSAGDSVFIMPDMPNVVSYNIGDGDLHRQLFQMTQMGDKKKVPVSKHNGDAVPKHSNNSLNIVNID